ncbi:MAG: epoxyqueuosine reductase QueH [Candidatus Saccharibacteria bacterium]|nr:epoxyqueuosine reductase QueH [Candidatus Saccharibacteria bacterium]
MLINMSQKVLMHTCCAPCSVYCIDALRSEGIEPAIFWYNPNIHPYIEYKTRRDCLKDYAKKVNAKSIFVEDYGLDEFCKNVVSDIGNRCVNYCYKKRLTETVRYAAKHGYDAFTTTLLVSPYQKHDELKKVCEELAALSGIEFIYRDFRVGFREGQDKARKMGLYMQKYCGCIFSEEDRYKKQIEKDLNINK